MSEFIPTLEQGIPIVTSSVQAVQSIIGGLQQQDLDQELAKRAQSVAREQMADQRILNRITLSAARAASVQAGTDTPNLDILMQLAIQGERRLQRIKSNGDVGAWYYRNLGDQALYESLGKAGFALGQGFASAYERGWLTSSPAKATPGRFGTTLPLPGSGGSTTLPASADFGGTVA
jgi:hypothetical protein